MRARSQEGFTLIELMVALVVAGVLMATLVGISGSVQRSFGRSKDIIELQANLRFAMNCLVDDFSRAAYMYSPNPDNTTFPIIDRRTEGPLPLEAEEAIAYDQTIDTFILRGNYISARDYRWSLDDSVILDRDELPVGSSGILAGNRDINMRAFERPFDDVFCPGELIRLARNRGMYSYHTVNTAASGNSGLTLTPPPARSRVLGEHKWVSPVTTLRYQMVQDPAYVSPYTGGVLEAQRWTLQRIATDCRGEGGLDQDLVVEVVDFLMPPVSVSPGFVVVPYYDGSSTGEVCGNPVQPNMAGHAVPITDADPLDPVGVRAVVIVLRGRTEMEDPALTVAHPDHSVDLDGVPLNGMAQVRVQRTVVEMPNIGITYCL